MRHRPRTRQYQVQVFQQRHQFTCFISEALSSINAAIAETSGKSVCSCLASCLYCKSGGFGADVNSEDSDGDEGVDDPSAAFSATREVPGVGAEDTAD
jgi:hypothetical protein